MSDTNARRHEKQMVLRSNDLITAKDCVRIVADVVAKYDTHTLIERQRAFNALPWWRRFLRGTP